MSDDAHDILRRLEKLEKWAVNKAAPALASAQKKANAAQDRVRELELELAELRGKVEAVLRSGSLGGGDHMAMFEDIVYGKQVECTACGMKFKEKLDKPGGHNCPKQGMRWVKHDYSKVK